MTPEEKDLIEATLFYHDEFMSDRPTMDGLKNGRWRLRSAVAAYRAAGPQSAVEPTQRADSGAGQGTELYGPEVQGQGFDEEFVDLSHWPVDQHEAIKRFLDERAEPEAGGETEPGSTPRFRPSLPSMQFLFSRLSETLRAKKEKE